MPDTQIVKTDQGGVNDRILAKEVKADFRRIEAASLKMTTHLTSAEAKRLFVRYFSTLQLNAHFVSVIARTKLEHEDVERVEGAIREKLESVTADLNKAIDGAELLFRANGITGVATYDTQPLALAVGVISSFGRRYFEVLVKLDQLMPLIQTLEIHEVITTRAADIQRATIKRAVGGIAGAARHFATGLRRRMNEAAMKEAKAENERGRGGQEEPRLRRGANTGVQGTQAIESVVNGALGREERDGARPVPREGADEISVNEQRGRRPATEPMAPDEPLPQASVALG